MEERIEEKRIGVIFHHMLQNGPWLKCRTSIGKLCLIYHIDRAISLLFVLIAAQHLNRKQFKNGSDDKTILKLFQQETARFL